MATPTGWTPVQPSPGSAWTPVGSSSGWTEVTTPSENAKDKEGHPIVSALKDVGIGVVKGGGQTFVNLGHLVHLVPGVSDAIDAVFGVPGLSRQAFASANETLKPTNTAQTVGKVGEQIAEVAIPTNAIRGASTAAVARFAPALEQAIGQTAARAIPAAVVEGAANAGIAAAQGGNAVAAGALGSAMPAAGAALRATGVPEALRDKAETLVVQALGPTKERFKAMAERLAPEILKRGLGGSREALQARAADMVEQAGQRVDDALQQYGGQAVDTAPILSALEGAKDAFRTTGANGAVVEFETRAIRQLSGLQQIIADLGPSPRVDQLVAVRRAWDKVVDQAGGYAQRAGGAIGMPLRDQSEAWAKREATGAIRSLLADDVPDLAAINKEFAFWKGIDDVLTQTLKRTAPQKPGLGGQIAEAAGQAVGSVAGSGAGVPGTIGGALVLGRVANMAQAVLGSPRWKFVDAKLRNTLADAIASGNQSSIVSALWRASAVETSKF